MKVCPKCQRRIIDESVNYCPEDGTLLERYQDHLRGEEVSAESGEVGGVTGNSLNRMTIACVVVVFCVAFLMFAEGDVVTFFTVYDFAVPGASCVVSCNAQDAEKKTIKQIRL